MYLILYRERMTEREKQKWKRDGGEKESDRDRLSRKPHHSVDPSAIPGMLSISISLVLRVPHKHRFQGVDAHLGWVGRPR